MGAAIIRRAILGAVSLAGLFWSAPALAGGMTCTVAAIQAAAPKDTTISKVELVAAPVPNCRVDGYVTTTDPGPNQVNFRLQLPTQNFANRYYFIGLGGSAGYVPTDSQIPAGNPIVKGFAVAGTDTGRQGSSGDWDFLGESEAKALDHVHRGGHVAAVATQAITRDFYGTSKLYRYHSGCSGGGRMGMMAIIHHPEDYDGVLLGAPGGRSSGTMLKFIHASRAMMEPGAWVSPAKLKMVDDKVTAACDLTDGAKDGVVWDHRLCKFDMAQLQCRSADGADCLTAPQVKALKTILAGVRGPDGKLISEPMPIVNMETWGTFFGQVPPPWNAKPAAADRGRNSAAYTIASSLARAYFGPDYDVKNFDFSSQKDIDAWWAAAKRTGFGEPYSTDLSGLQKAGHKVLFWNGRGDLCCSDIEMEAYYKELGTRFGPAARDKFAALYQIPGMGHCGGGTGPQDSTDILLSELVDWVEKGVKPGPVVAHRGAERVKLSFADPKTGQVSGVVVPPPTGAARDFLLCPYPQYAAYSGRGAVEDAVNWSCKTPKPGEERQG